VQLVQPGRGGVALDALAQKLTGVGRLSRNPFLLRLEVDGYTLTVFPDGRAIIGGTDDIPTARTVYAKYIGA
jgi:adenylyltransferase/sulfurtransferase